MSKPFKITGFTRFLLFLLLFVPTVVFGVLYAKHGEEGLSIDKAIELFSGEEITTDPNIKIEKLENDIKKLEAKIAEKQAEIRDLKSS